MLPITFDFSTLDTTQDDSLSFGLNTLLAGPVSSEVDSHSSTIPRNQDPLLQPFPQDAVIVEENSKTVRRWQDGWQPRQVVVQKLYSESQDMTWANAYIPDDTFVFLREQAIANGTQSVHGLTQSEGVDYFWAQSSPLAGDTTSQACVSIPILPFGIGHNLYDHLCTDSS